MEGPTQEKPAAGESPAIASPRQHSQKGEQATSERIRPELNIEKWPAMWRPSHSPNAPAVRVLEREHALKGGGRVRARVEVGFSHLGELTTEDQRTYYALVKQWEVSGRSPQQTFFSVRGLAKFLHKKWGTNVITAVSGSLRRLRATPITWEDAYFDASRRETLEEIDTFNILSELKIVRKKVDGHVTKEAGYFRFNDFTLRNLLNHHTKPVLFETILQFRSDLAQLLYTHLDLIMADKRVYERRVRELFLDLGLRGSDYERLYERKRVLARAIAELRGVPLTTGVIARIEIEKTQDNKDYKLIVSKGSSLFKQAEIRKPAAGRGLVRQVLVSTPAATQAEELVEHFHKLFHNVTQVYHQSKEISHATALIAQHGFERAKYIVDYAHLAAAQTGYFPQTFGGILQYTSKALAAYEDFVRKNEAAARAREEAKACHAFETLHAELAEKRRNDAEERLAHLPPPEYEALHAKVKAALESRSHWLPQNASSKLFERMVRSAMIAELMRQMGAPEQPETRLS